MFMHKEDGNILLVVVGVVAILFLIGFFRSAPAFWETVNYKTILRLPCGLTVKHPKFAKDEKAAFPLELDGYVNGCGWTVEGGIAGTAQVFDGKGLPLTAPTPMTVPGADESSPYYFDTQLRLIAAPSTDTGNILLRSASGLLYPIAVSF